MNSCYKLLDNLLECIHSMVEYRINHIVINVLYIIIIVGIFIHSLNRLHVISTYLDHKTLNKTHTLTANNYHKCCLLATTSATKSI